MQYRKLLAGILSVISVALFPSCHGLHSGSADTEKKQFCLPDSLLKNISFDTLRSEPVNTDLTLSGKITYNEDHVSKIFPLVSGRVAEVMVSVGDFAEKGKVLAVIRSSDMANYFNEYKSSQSALAIAKKNLEVTAALKSSGVSSEKDYLVAQSEYQQAVAQYNKISEVLRIFGGSLSPKDSTGSDYIIRSPISGFIVDKDITPGKDIRPDDNSVLFTISDLKEVWAVANVFETDISKIREGATANITTLSYPDTVFTGKIERISNMLDPETKVMRVKVMLGNPDFKLKPGMFAHFVINIPGEKNMLAIKSTSIIFSDNQDYLLWYRGKCNVTIQRVTVFNTCREISFIESDSLHAGDRVIAHNGLFVFTELETL